MRAKITCLVPCRNERLNIRPCIESLQDLADELLIADSGSTDGTLDIVREIGGCRIIEREYIHSGDFKNWAIPQAEHSWVLLVDADERVTPQLADEIRRILSLDNPMDGYWVYRKNHFMGHHTRSCGWANDCCLRLFRRDVSRYVGPNDHAEVHVSTNHVGTLRNRLDHFTYWSYDQWFKKFDRYTKVQAQLWYEAGRRPSLWRLLVHAPFRFFRDYICQGGFLEGKVGLQVAMLAAFYSFMKQARLWELHYAKQRPDPEANRKEDADEDDGPEPNKKLYFDRLNAA